MRRARSEEGSATQSRNDLSQSLLDRRPRAPLECLFIGAETNETAATRPAIATEAEASEGKRAGRESRGEIGVYVARSKLSGQLLELLGVARENRSSEAKWTRVDLFNPVLHRIERLDFQNRREGLSG